MLIIPKQQVNMDAQHAHSCLVALFSGDRSLPVLWGLTLACTLNAVSLQPMETAAGKAAVHACILRMNLEL